MSSSSTAILMASTRTTSDPHCSTTTNNNHGRGYDDYGSKTVRPRGRCGTMMSTPPPPPLSHTLPHQHCSSNKSTTTSTTLGLVQLKLLLVVFLVIGLTLDRTLAFGPIPTTTAGRILVLSEEVEHSPASSSPPFTPQRQRSTTHQQQRLGRRCGNAGVTRLGAAREPPPNDNNNNNNNNRSGGAGIFDFLTNPYETQIPPELQTEIYAAEANTPAARDRQTRIAMYAIAAVLGFLAAFFNGFLTELRADHTITLNEAGFGWAQSNVVVAFLLTNQIGGVLCLLGGGAAGLLAEAEYDTRRINAEKIFQELQRRRAAKSMGSSSKKKTTVLKKKKGLSGKEQKRMNALSEVILEKDTTITAEDTVSSPMEDASKKESSVNDNDSSKGGILGTIQNFYQRADSLAASQALLLNKKLEEQGLVEKITDETGLKVIGKEEAAKLQQQRPKEEGEELASEKNRS